METRQRKGKEELNPALKWGLEASEARIGPLLGPGDQSVAVYFLELEPRLRKRLERKRGGGSALPANRLKGQGFTSVNIGRGPLSSILDDGKCRIEDLDSSASSHGTPVVNPMTP